jgi:branched-chain amino acid transport system permease protein
MFYREAGDFKTSYSDDAQTFPIAFDRWRYYLVLAVAFGLIPLLINDYWEKSVMVPFLIFTIVGRPAWALAGLWLWARIRATS